MNCISCIWKCFPRSFVGGIHRSPGDFLTKASNTGSGVLDNSLNILLNKQSGCRWFETAWRTCGVTVIIPGHVALRLIYASIIGSSTKRANTWKNNNNYKINYSIHVPGWLQKWLNLITAPGSVSNEPGSVTWLATKYLKLSVGEVTLKN